MVTAKLVFSTMLDGRVMFMMSKADTLALKLNSEIDGSKDSDEMLDAEETVKFSKLRKEVLFNGQIVPIFGPITV